MKFKVREMYYRDYQNFRTNSFRENLNLILDRMNKAFDSFEPSTDMRQ